MAIATLEEYLKEFSVEIGNRILTSFPALHTPGDPVPPILGKLLRKPFAAQTIAIAGAAQNLRQGNSVAIIAEMGTGKTLMAIALSFVFAAGRPYACLFFFFFFFFFCRSAAITAEDGARDSANDPRRQDICDRQLAVAATRSIWAARR